MSNNVLEQRRWFAWPPRKLVEEYGKNYGVTKGLGLTMIVPSVILIDTALTKVLDHSEFYNSINSSMKTDPFSTFAVMGGSVVSLFGFPLLAGYLCERLGPIADAKCVKD